MADNKQNAPSSGGPQQQSAIGSASAANTSAATTAPAGSVLSRRIDEEPHVLGKGDAIKRPQDANVITPGDIIRGPQERVDEMLHAQHRGERHPIGPTSPERLGAAHASTSAGQAGAAHHGGQQQHVHHEHPHGAGLPGAGGNMSMGLRKASGPKDF